MDRAFYDLISKTMNDYQDYLNVHSKVREQHLEHLRKVFRRCIMHNISLDPKKWLFIVSKGKLLGNIVSVEGIPIDLEWIKDINDLNPPTNRKGFQYFFGKIYFVGIFFLDYALIVKPINRLLKNDQEFEWTLEV